MESLRPVISRGLLMKVEEGGVDLAAKEALLISNWYRNEISGHPVEWHWSNVFQRRVWRNFCDDFGEVFLQLFKRICVLVHGWV